MLAGYLAAMDAQGELWLTVDNGSGPLAIAYCAPERMTDGTWNLLLTAVDPERRISGIGAVLLAHIEGALRGLGQRVLLVETSGVPDFERTRRFYRENGYDEEARIRDFHEAGDDRSSSGNHSSRRTRPSPSERVAAPEMQPTSSALALARGERRPPLLVRGTYSRRPVDAAQSGALRLLEVEPAAGVDESRVTSSREALLWRLLLRRVEGYAAGAPTFCG